MALPEKLYTLRKRAVFRRSSLQRLNVSRQAISKWEGGSAMPESDKLLALSNYFGVSLDYLLKTVRRMPRPPKRRRSTGRCGFWYHSLLRRRGRADRLWRFVDPCPVRSRADQRIVDDPHRRQWHFLLLCVAAIAAGAALLLKSTKHK